MTARILDGKGLARTWNEGVAHAVRDRVSRGARVPGLAVVLVGEDPASQVYVQRKAAVAARVGLQHRQIDLPATASMAQVLETVDALNDDPSIDGILVQLPLPGGLDGRTVTERIRPDKDVDGLTTASIGALAQGRPRMVPCTPAGVLRMLTHAEFPLAGAEAVVIGRSNLFGRPMAMLLEQADATVTVAHSRTRDLPAVARRAQVLIVAVGRPELVRADWVRDGAVVIDVGVNRLDGGRLVGDVAFDEVAPKVEAITPVPGGVGPTTIAMLMANTLRACELRS